MADASDPIEKEKIRHLLEYLSSTSDGIQEQIVELLNAGILSSLCDILVEKMYYNEEKIYDHVFEELFLFENFIVLAENERFRGLPMLDYLVSHLWKYIVSFEENPRFIFSPWPWLAHFLENENPLENFVAGIYLDIWDEKISLSALFYASLYCDLELESDKFTHFYNLAYLKYGLMRSIHQCKMIFEGRIKGHSITEMFEWFD